MAIEVHPDFEMLLSGFKVQITGIVTNPPEEVTVEEDDEQDD